MRQKLAQVAALFVALAIAGGPACAIDLKQAREIARPATISLNVVANECDGEAVNNLKGTGFLINSAGLVLTAAHLFGSADCPYRDVEVVGVYGQQTWANVDAGSTLSFTVVGVPDFARDLAVLQVQSDVPPALKPLRICPSYTPVGAESLFAFGHPFGKPLVPLELTYSATDADAGYWQVSGLTTGGMSGGPVLDEYGNAIGLIHGGLVQVQSVSLPAVGMLQTGDAGTGVDIPIHALQFVAPLTSIGNVLPNVGFSENCGIHHVPQLPTYDSFSRETWEDERICGLRLPQEFQVRRRDKAVAVVSLDPAQSESIYAGLLASKFRLEVERLAIPQYGLNSANYDRRRDVLACEAASLWIEEYDWEGAFADKSILPNLSAATRSGSSLPIENDRCYETSDWPSKFIRGRPIESRMPVPVGMNERPRGESRANRAIRVERIPMAFAETRDRFIGSLFVYSRDRSLTEAQMAFKEKDDPLREIFDSDSESKLFGLHVGCEAYDNVDYQDFKRLCTSLSSRILFGKGNDSADCLEEQSESHW